MEAVGRAMSSNERIGESGSEVAKENPKPRLTLEDDVTNTEEAQSKVESVGEAPQERPEEVLSDFFSVNESSLGYKSRLSLAIRKALTRLEHDASRQTGLPVEKLRAQFLSIQTGRRPHFEELRVRPEYVMGDYRVFLIFFVTLIRRQGGIS